MSTYSIKAGDIQRQWFIVDASGKTLGRLASVIATRLRGKHKAEYTPHMDTGDYIIVVNASKITVTGNKLNDKMYHRHTGFVGNLKSTPLKDMMAKKPEEVIKIAVKGMLPKGPLGRDMFRKLKVFAKNEHTHTAQQPTVLDI